MNEEKSGVRALSVRQPWAWLIVHGYKDIENRSWPTKYRGPVLIHAGKKFEYNGYAEVCRRFPSIRMLDPDEFERGGIVGRANVADCVGAYSSEWFCGPFGFVLMDRAPCAFQACAGRLGFFVPDGVSVENR